ncbi:MAG: T9SS type A sorting domain-containing protein [Bacteroidota bacterium]
MYSIEECSTLVNFFSTAMNGEQHQWDFDGNLSTIESTAVNPAHDFQQVGTFTVTHTVTDDCGNSSTTTQTIVIEECPGNLCDCPTVINAGAGTLLTDTNLPFSSLNNTGSCIAISGTLIVNTSTYRITGGEIQMLPGARIIIDDFRRLELDQVHLYGCDQMWQGIEINEGANLTLSRSLVEDAHWAVNASHQSSLDVFRSVFNKNYVGVYTPVTGGGSSQFVNMRLDRVAFQCTDDLLPRYTGQPGTSSSRSWAGVQLNNAQSIVIGGFWGTPAATIYNGLQHGIYLNNCFGIQIQEPRISNLIERAVGIYLNNSTQIVTDAAQMTGVNTGVLGWGSHPIIRNSTIDSDGGGVLLYNGAGRSAFIGNNRITSNRSCIELWHYTGSRAPVQVIQNTLYKRTATNAFAVYAAFCTSRLSIKDNPDITFEGGNGIWLSNSTGEITVENNTNIRYAGNASFIGSTGIHLDVVSGAQLFNNRVTTNGGQIFAGISACDSPGNLYCCNTVDNSFYGTLFNGGCMGTVFRNTDFGNHADGLVLGDAIIGLQDLHGNSWAGANCVQSDAFFYSNSSSVDVLRSQFITNSNLLPREYDFIQVFGGGTPQEWFLFEGNDPACSYYCNDPPHNPLLPPDGPCIHQISEEGINTIDNWAATALGSTNLLNEGIHNREQHRLLQKLNCLPHLLGQDADIDQFYQSSAGSTLEQFHSLRNGIHQLFAASADETLSSLYTQYHSLIQEIQAANEQLGFGAIEGTGTRDSLVEVLGGVSGQIDQIESMDWQSRLSYVDDLIAQNTVLDAAKVYELNERMINQIYLNTLAKGIHTFDTIQQNQINGVAAQCPLVGGRAVHQARALQALFAPQYYNDDEACANVLEDRALFKQSEKEDLLLKVYPNPAADVLYIQYEEEKQLDLTIDIYSLNGKSCLQQTFLTNQAISIATLPEGMYFYVIRDTEGTLVLRDKLLILRK